MYWISKEIKDKWIRCWPNRFRIPEKKFWNQKPHETTGLPKDVLGLFNTASRVMQYTKDQHIIPALAETIPVPPPGEYVHLFRRIIMPGENEEIMRLLHACMKESIKYYSTIDKRIDEWLKILNCYLYGKKKGIKHYEFKDTLIDFEVLEMQSKSYQLGIYPEIKVKLKKHKNNTREIKVNIENAIVNILKEIFLYLKDNKQSRIERIKTTGLQNLLVAIWKDLKYSKAKKRTLKILNIYIAGRREMT